MKQVDDSRAELPLSLPTQASLARHFCVKMKVSNLSLLSLAFCSFSAPESLLPRTHLLGLAGPELVGLDGIRHSAQAAHSGESGGGDVLRAYKIICFTILLICSVSGVACAFCLCVQ